MAMARSFPETVRAQDQHEWKRPMINLLDGKVEREDRLQHPGGQAALIPPQYQEDIALKITN